MNAQGNYNQTAHKTNAQKNPYRFAIIILSLIVFASAVLPGWFVVTTKTAEYAGQGMAFEQTGQLQTFSRYTYRDHGYFNFNILLQTTQSDHFSVNCSPAIKNLSIFTFVFFVLSLLMYITTQRIQYAPFILKYSPIISFALLISHTLCCNRENITIVCSDRAQASYTMGVTWWISLILLAVLAIYNIVHNKNGGPSQGAGTKKEKEDLFQQMVDASGY